MEIDASLPPVSLTEVGRIARAAEALGFSALWSSETIHDPFLPGAIIAEQTQRINFGPAIAVAFARSPATLAYTAWDLAQASGGRFILGLGTQVKAHIERRFGMPWPVSTAGKLRDQIGALRAFWNCWQTGAPLDYRSESYRLSLMTPFFNPGPIAHPDIPIYIAGVNTGLARLAGELADGFLVHPFHSPAYLSDVLLPAIRQSQQKANRPDSAVKISATVFAVTTPAETAFARSQIAFYASTPSYQPVMAFHGWEETAVQLSELATKKHWREMPALIKDEMLHTFAIVCEPHQVAGRLAERYNSLAQRLGLYLPVIPGERDDFWRSLIAELQERGEA